MINDIVDINSGYAFVRLLNQNQNLQARKVQIIIVANIDQPELFVQTSVGFLAKNTKSTVYQIHHKSLASTLDVPDYYKVNNSDKSSVCLLASGESAVSSLYPGPEVSWTMACTVASSGHCSVQPVSVGLDLGIDPWGVGLGTPLSPGHHAQSSVHTYNTDTS